MKEGISGCSRYLILLIPLALFGMLTVSTAWSATEIFNPVKDNTIYEGQAGGNPPDNFEDNSCGIGTNIFAGATDDGFARRALLKFDIAAQIPAGSTINSVVLTAQVNRERDGAARTMTLHPLDKDWGEGTVNCDNNAGGGQGDTANAGDATWLNAKFQQIGWDTPGGDFGSASASASVANGQSVLATWDSSVSGNEALVTDVAAWLGTPASNNGWIMLGEESVVKTARRFYSREGSTPPVLTVDFTPPASTSACCFTNGDCSILTPTNCTTQGGTTDASTSCSPNPCPQPVGACCNLDESCSDAIARDVCEAGGGTFEGSGVACTTAQPNCGLEPFVDALPIPPALTPTGTRPDGAEQYAIDVRTATQTLHSQLPPTTDLWTYNGAYPSFTIEARVGDPIEVTFTNSLPLTHPFQVDECSHGPNMFSNSARISTHLHGGHVPARFDGQPEYTILPGEMDVYEYPNSQLPGTLWYHDHALGITRLNVYAGMAGFYLLRDDFEDSLGLPAGEYEIPIAIQDRKFNPDGSLSYPTGFVNGFYGDKTLANGKVWPYLDVKQGKYRFRLLNGSQAREYTLRLENLADAGQVIPFTLIGTDLGLISAPMVLNTIKMVPGERFDVIVDFTGFTAGTEIVLRNDDLQAPRLYNVMKFNVTADTGFTGAIPSTLRSVTAIPEGEATTTRWFSLEQISEACAGNEWVIKTMDGPYPSGTATGDKLWDDISEDPQLGTTEIWEFENPSSMMHPMHIHLVAFQVLSRSVLSTGAALPLEPHEIVSWKDIVRVGADERVRVIARFEDYPGRFAYHCHILDHEDHEMMRQFQTVNDPANCDNDGFCEAGEDAFNCTNDCTQVSGAFCGNGLCETGDGEDCLTCAVDCAGEQTGGGGDYCCGSGGTNPIGCGIDATDDRCIDGEDQRFCRDAPRLLASCGDHLCEGQETAASCAQDCSVPFCDATEITNEVTCDDALDNDCDGTIDIADTDCQPQITTTFLPATKVGRSYNQTVVAVGGTVPYTWTVISGFLPSGLSLNSSTGVISGTTTSGGYIATFTVQVTDNLGATDTQVLKINVRIPNCVNCHAPPGL
ncbi:MAG: multicopper oxidase domain-containing protein [Gammaproteobacteria bacterium]|nr:multicopper oxidase domain-containing protein [Gammaproteobacteria bacterium]